MTIGSVTTSKFDVRIPEASQWRSTIVNRDALPHIEPGKVCIEGAPTIETAPIPLCQEVRMQRMPDEPYRELRALFDDLVRVLDAVQQRVDEDDSRFRPLADLLRQAHAYQNAACERCGEQFQAQTNHPEFYPAGGYSKVCPRCNRELADRPQP